MNGSWPWILMALLGAYHGLNPAMGWLFAVGLGMQERSGRAVLRALPAIAIGHELSIALVAGLVVFLGVVTDTTVLHVGAALVLIGFGVFRFAKPHAHFRWTRMQVNGKELTLWSFLMSTAHGAGLMVAPILIGGGAAEASAHDHALSDLKLQTLSIPQTALAVTLHVGAMLLVMAAVSTFVYTKVGVGVLRRAWVNSDYMWASAFVMAGAITFVT